MPQYLGNRVEFSSLAGADLRGASIGNLCCALPGLETAKLDGVTTYLYVTPDGMTETERSDAFRILQSMTRSLRDGNDGA